MEKERIKRRRLCTELLRRCAAVSVEVVRLLRGDRALTRPGSARAKAGAVCGGCGGDGWCEA